MANETSLTAPYEILLRFNCEIGEVAGHLRGMSLAQKVFMVDDDGLITARLDRGNADMPAEFPPEQLSKLLGDNFVAFEAQQRALADKVAAAEKAVADARDAGVKAAAEAVAAAQADGVKAMQEAMAKASADAAALQAKLDQAASAADASAQRIADLETQLTATQARVTAAHAALNG